MVYSRRLYLSSSYWTESSITPAERRIILFSAEIHWCHQVNSHRFGCSTRKTDWRLLECRRRQKSVRFVDRFHEIHTIGRNSSERIHVVREKRLTRIRTTSRPDHIWPDAWTRIGKAAQRREKTRMGNRETETRTCQKIERHLFYWSEWWRVQRHHSKCKAKVGDIKGSCNAMQKSVLPGMHTGNQAKASEAKTRFSCITEAHESTRQRAESVTRRIHEEHFAGKRQNSVLHCSLVHKFIPTLQAMKITDAKAAMDKEWKKLETIPAWVVRKV